ncbi:hypothetical protein ARMGADRAFT_1164567 [Armillaria gallica]|uniref:Uncharacterized protein n=1 Tax=Armillaria gallica TaxID=47427 RepID=A0A2H3DGH2_ARMGA|nr:hypothetical protein ARMGADRAFT_1164567 [Armillaria gallica]
MELAAINIPSEKGQMSRLAVGYEGWDILTAVVIAATTWRAPESAMKRLFAGTRSLVYLSPFVDRYHVLLSLKKVANGRTRLPVALLLQLFYAAVILGGCASLPKAPGIPKSADVAPYGTVYYFDQLIDHDVLSKGTFKQRYWYNAEFYKEDGPIIFMNASEVDASGIVPHYFALHAALLQDSGDCIGSEKLDGRGIECHTIWTLIYGFNELGPALEDTPGLLR